MLFSGVTKGPDNDSAFQSAVRAGMEAIGESGADSSFYFLRERFGLKLADLHDHPQQFCQAVRDIFGPGSAILLRSIRDKIRVAVSDEKLDSHYCRAFVESLDSSITAVDTGVE